MPLEQARAAAHARVPGAGAVLLDRLNSGLANESYRVARDGRWYALRVAVPNAEPLGVEREWECRVLGSAAAQGLCPFIECCDPQAGVLVARWVSGRSWSPEQAALAANLDKMASLARRVHALAVPGRRRAMAPADWIALYGGALARHGAEAIPAGRAPARHIEALAALPPAPPVLCHSDLHVQNLLESDEGLVLLDWEYAHVSEAAWDIAAWSCNNDLSADSGGVLLASYLGRPPRDAERERLEHLRWLYDYVCLLWIELHRRLRGGGSLASRGEFLAARLGLLDPEFGGRAG